MASADLAHSLMNLSEARLSRNPGPDASTSTTKELDGWAPWNSSVNILSPPLTVPHLVMENHPSSPPLPFPLGLAPGYNLEAPSNDSAPANDIAWRDTQLGRVLHGVYDSVHALEGMRSQEEVDELLARTTAPSCQIQEVLQLPDYTSLNQLHSELRYKQQQLNDAQELMQNMSADFTSSMVGMNVLIMNTAADADCFQAESSILKASLQAVTCDLTEEKSVRQEAQRAAQHSLDAAAEHQQRVQQLQQQVSDLLAHRRVLHTEQQASAAVLDNVRQELTAAQQQAADAEQQQSALKQQAAAAEQLVVAAKQQAVAAQQSARTAKQKAIAAQQQAAAGQKKVSHEQKNKAAAQQQQIATLAQHLRQLQQQHSNLQVTLEAAQQQGTEAAADREDLENKLQVTKAAKQQMAAEHKRLQGEVLKAKAVAAKLKRGHADAAALTADCRVVSDAFEHLQTLQQQQDQVKGLRGFLNRQQLQTHTKAAMDEVACAVKHMASTARLVRPLVAASKLPTGTWSSHRIDVDFQEEVDRK